MQLAMTAINITTFPILLCTSHLLRHQTNHLQSAVASCDLGVLCLNATESLSLAVGEIVHGGLGDVETVASVVDSKNIDSLAVVCDAIAGSALCAVPALNTHVASDTGEASDGALVLPAVLGDQTILAIRAGNGGERAASIIVASVVGDCVN